jgi:hypothetical protein
MSKTRVNIFQTIKESLPLFIREQFPLFGDLLEEYYISLEKKTGVYDILQQINENINLNNLTSLVESTIVTETLYSFNKEIIVSTTDGFPEKNGLLKINDEIIFYREKTFNSFLGCARGFSGITSFGKELNFTTTNSNNHDINSIVYNINAILLKEFLNKIKVQLTPGFENVSFYDPLNENVFIKQSSDFYKSKGSDESFNILFLAIFGSPVNIIKPRENVIEPSSAIYQITNDFLVESISGNVEDCLNRTIYQNTFGDISFGTITNIKRVDRYDKNLYILSIDFNYGKDVNVRGTLYGNFVYNETTQLVSDYQVGNKSLSVDSTIGFDSSGKLYLTLPDGDNIIIDYNDKTTTEFLDIQNLNRDVPKGTSLTTYNFAYVNLNDGIVEFKIYPVLSDPIFDNNSSLLLKDDTTVFSSIGEKSDLLKANDWFFNIAVKNDVKQIFEENLRLNIYKISFYTDVQFYIDDTFKLYSSDSTIYNLRLLSRVSSFEYIFISDKIISNINTLKFYTERNLSKSQFLNFELKNDYNSNIQNVYLDTDNSVYVTSGSLPFYDKSPISTLSKSITFSGNYSNESENYILNIGKHSLTTGDMLIYSEPLIDENGFENENILSIPNGRYFVRVVDRNRIKLSTSISKLFNNEYINFYGNVSNNKLYYFNYDLFEPSYISSIILDPNFYYKIDHQNLIKLLKDPQNNSMEDTTIKSGPIGIFKNGVEIISYKSNDILYYGKIKTIDVLSGGSNYDVLNPPEIVISDLENYGSGCEAFVEVSGYLDRIDVVSPGVGFYSDPIVKIQGGNGFGAIANPIVESRKYFLEFNSSNGDIVNLNNNTLTFPYEIYFYTGEKIQYFTNSGIEIGGLSDTGIYYVRVINNFTIKLYSNYENCLNDVNPINLLSYGSGTNSIVALQNRSVITTFEISSKGENYRNKKLLFDSNSDVVNIYNNTIQILNHGLETGDKILYTSDNVAIGGLIKDKIYFVYKIDNQTIKLCDLGSDNLSERYFLDKKIFLTFTSVGSGTNLIQHEPIQVIVTDVNNNINSTFNYNPVFKGEIKSVWVYNGGSNYGSNEIINYNRQPQISIKNGIGAKLKPIIIDGRIVSVVIENSGYDYFSTPEIEIIGTGFNAKLIPIINDGIIDDIIIANPGFGYDNSTFINVKSSGLGSKFFANIDTWTINIVERDFSNKLISDDDGFIYKTDNIKQNNYGLKYTHAYAPRKLRGNILTKRLESGIERYIPDIIFDLVEKKEIDSKYHSPILGWAYDGNPIYGPYGFTNIDGTGNIKRLRSGYSLVTKPNRPSNQLYPLGYFVEDYEYFDNGDLDIHNGRFCITPEYPSGIYAYFCTIGDIDVEYKNYRKPQFPYVIGNLYKSLPIKFNFDTKITQNTFSYDNVLRNTNPYNIFEENSGYDYINQSKNIKNKTSIVNLTTLGELDKINIISSGDNYKVNDDFVFDSQYVKGFTPKAKVISLKGKEIDTIGYATTSIENVVLTNYGANQYIAISSSPHNLETGLIFFYDQDSKTNLKLDTTIPQNTFILGQSLNNSSITGITTYINLIGDLKYPNIIVNDILFLDNEQVKVLEIDRTGSRIKILRQYNSTIGSAHSLGIPVLENPRKLLFSDGPYSEIKNTEIYFDPKESLGIGIGTTALIKNPGINDSSIFIDAKKIYLKNNNLDTNTKLIYDSNGGFPISVSLGVTSFRLINGQELYSYRFNNDFIGIATVPVTTSSEGNIIGIGTGANVDLLSFNDYGLGEYHSFKTDNEVKIVKINTSKLTISTKQNHLLENNDIITLDVKYKSDETLKVVYNDQNRRFGINPVIFNSSSVNIEDNYISITDHNFYTGQKVIHTSSNPVGGLTNNNIYYVIVLDNNKVSLSETYDDSISNIAINLTSTSFGRILPINPKIIVQKNKNILFDLSDESLSYVRNNIKYSAFNFNLYIDSDLKTKFTSTRITNKFNVSKQGRIGIDLTAQLLLKYDDNLPEILYYNLDPIKNPDVPNFKYEVGLDDSDENIVSYIESSYNKNFKVNKLSQNSFKIYLDFIPEEVTNLTSIANITYSTTSNSSLGEVFDIELESNGSKLSRLPNIEKVNTSFGVDFFGIPNSTNIGKIKLLEIPDISNIFTSDITLRPKSNFPVSLKVDPLSSVEKIDVISYGKNYTNLPDLILIDGFTKKPKNDLNLLFDQETKKVKILTNTTGIYNVTPSIIPINNTNGYKISSLIYDDFEKTATATLDTVGFSTLSDFPFTIGSKVLLENVVTSNPDTDFGYNSKNYDYALFTVVDNDPNIGGQSPTVTFSMGEFLGSNSPGFYDSIYTSARIISSSDFPIFNVEFRKNSFFNDEIVTQNSGFEGQVINWDANNEILKIKSNNFKNLNKTDLVVGKSSLTFGNVSSIIGISTVTYNFNSSSIQNKKWINDKGFLNSDNQRLHDSNYYQYFSYAINSNIDSNIWDQLVQNLNHTAGFKRFSNLSIDSSSINSELEKNQNFGSFFGIANINGFADLNCIYDFDLVTENYVEIDPNNYISDEIRFESKRIQDYFESIGNRVLVVDDISDEFNSNPRATRFSIVDEFKLSDFKYKKYFINTTNKLFTSDRQSIIVNLLHDSTYGYLNQYGRVETTEPHGYFDFTVFGDYGYLLYYPIEYEFFDYNINGISINVGESLIGAGVTTLGDIVSIASTNTIIPSGSSSGVPIIISNQSTDYRSSKYIIVIETNDGSYLQSDELNIVHDGNSVYVTEFANLETSTYNQDIGVGFCTYYSYINNNDLILSLIPNFNTSINFKVNIVSTNISDDNFVSIGNTVLNTTKIESNYTQILSSVNTTPESIININREYKAFYILASIEDETNDIYQFTELVAVRSNDEVYFTEFGRIITDESLDTTGIGTFSGIVNNITDQTEIYFEPLANRTVNLRLIVYSVENVDLQKSFTSINLNQSNVSTVYGDYFGTDNDIRRSFELTYKGFPIFERIINSEDPNIISIENNNIIVPNHFFVTGEKIHYSINENSFIPDSRIGIETSIISGISTDKLPEELYVIKINDSTLQVASTAESALKFNPEPLVLSQVGIGSQHKFSSVKSDSKCLFTIDNMIQSPVVDTNIKYELVQNVAANDAFIKLSGISSIFASDILRIDDEIMLVESIGVGSEQLVKVRRRWMGEKEIASYGIGSTVTKLSGNYTIYGKNVDFASAPYGKVPITQPQNQVGAPIIRPDDRDFTGITTNSYFSGRVFLRRGEVDTVDETYSKNYIFDNISSQFTGIKSEFTLKIDNNDITGISSSNAIILIKDIFQQPSRTGAAPILGNYKLIEDGNETILSFYPSTQEVNDDINVTSLPSGGVINSIGSTEGFGYQPLVSAGGTAIISGFGTISSISIGNSGSGYRSGIQTSINVYAQTSTSIEQIGIATAINGSISNVTILNPGFGYTTTNVPIIIFDSPIGYSNIPLIYSSESAQGIGTGAKIDIVVSQDSRVLDFNIVNNGFAYKEGEILTISINDQVGIPTDISKSFREFQIRINSTYSDEFTGWSFGDLQQLDPFDDLFDGVRKVFPIRFQGNRVSIISKNGSNIDVQATLLIFINGILQTPEKSYTFRGGSVLRFKEALKKEDTSNILFYRGTPNIDIRLVDLIEEVKEGDTAKIHSNLISQKQNVRQIEEIISTDIALTNPYSGPGLLRDETIEVPVNICRQTEDIVINGKNISKARSVYEPIINPVTNIIQNVSTSSTDVFVENIKTFFDNNLENINSIDSSQIEIISQDCFEVGIVSAIVSVAGSITGVDIINAGCGYTIAPTVNISSPINDPNSINAEIEFTINNGSINSYNILNTGRNYDPNNPPVILIESPKPIVEKIINVNYEGDFGYITGVALTTVGLGLTALSMEFYIDQNSYLRNSNINDDLQSSNGISGISTGYFFVIKNSNIGLGVTSLYNSGERLSSTENYFNNIFQVYDLNIVNKDILGIGITQIVEVYTLIESSFDLSLPSLDNTGFTFDNTDISFDSSSEGSSYFGDFSWGRIIFDPTRSRKNRKNFKSYYEYGSSGISTSPIIKRYIPLKYELYLNM